MNSSFGRFPFAPFALAAAAGLALPHQGAHAQTLSWNSPIGGSAGVAINWNPAQVPGAASVLNFNLANTYSVFFPAAVPASSQQNFNFGTVSFSALSPHAISTQLVVGLTTNSTPTVTFTGGSLSAPILAVASSGTSTATFSVTGSNADVSITGPSGVRVGGGGVGTLNITNGGSIRSTNAVLTSFAAGSQGTISVSGQNGGVRSELVTLDPSGGDLTVASSGPGSLTVSNGGLVNIADDAFIAPTATFTGSVSVGSSPGATSDLNITGDLHIGHNTVAAAAGTGSLSVTAGGGITVGGSTFLGDSTGGTGTLTLHNGADMQIGSLTVDSAHGVLNHLGGELQISNGVLSPANDRLVINGAPGESPRLTLSGSSTHLAAVSPAKALTVASSENGVLSVTNSSQVTVSAGDVVIADTSGSVGSLRCQTGGVLAIDSASKLMVSNAGFGELLIAADSQVSSGPVEVGATAPAQGLITVVGSNAELNVNGTVMLGGTSGGPGGIGTLTIGSAAPNSGTVTVTSGPIPGNLNTRIWSGGSLHIEAGGTLISDKIVGGNGSITLAGGTIEASNVSPNGLGPFHFAGTVNAVFQPTGSAVVNLTGPFSVRALFNDAAISVGDHTLSVLPSPSHEQARVGNCVLGALGTVVLPDGGKLLAGKTLSGDGVVQGEIENLGTITATGSGLRFEGLVTGLGQGIDGTAIQFGPNGGFTGTGPFGAANIDAEAGSRITSTSGLMMGNPSSSAGFESRGTLVLRSTVLITLQDSDGAVVTNVELTQTDPPAVPAVRSISGLTVRGLVTGTGKLDGFSLLQQNNPQIVKFEGATLSPSNESGPGSIFINGNSLFTPDSRIEIDIFDSTTHDEIRSVANLFILPNVFSVPSDITLGGTLVLRVAPGHTPVSGESHLIMSTEHGLLGPDGEVIGSFASVQAPRFWHINIVPDEISGQDNGVFAVYCPADFNEDGFLDFFDVDAFVSAFETGLPEGDFNGDGFIDFFDADDFTLAFEAGC